MNKSTQNLTKNSILKASKVVGAMGGELVIKDSKDMFCYLHIKNFHPLVIIIKLELEDVLCIEEVYGKFLQQIEAEIRLLCPLFFSCDINIEDLPITFVDWSKISTKLKTYNSYLLKLLWMNVYRNISLSDLKEANKIPQLVKIVAGPTNSGKTHVSLQSFYEGESGQYLGPLRLNAVEIAEKCREKNIGCSLYTGQMKAIVENSLHRAATIELYSKDFHDVTVVDEAQLIFDEARGPAYVEAILNANTNMMLLTCPEWAVDGLISFFNEVGINPDVEYKIRKSPLQSKPTNTSYKDIAIGTAVVAFSRERLFKIRKEIPKHIKVSFLYGDMEPEVKLSQEKDFNEGTTDVLLATDCISMGLNLPIQHIVLDSVQKFDGFIKRNLFAKELQQIIGRAGRYGIYPVGYFSGNGLLEHYKTIELSNQCIPKLNLTPVVSLTERIVYDYMTYTNKQCLISALEDFNRHLIISSDKFKMCAYKEQIDNLMPIRNILSQLHFKNQWKLAHYSHDINKSRCTYVQCCEVLAGVAKNIEFDITLASHNKRKETISSLEKKLAIINCLIWFCDSFEGVFDNILDISSLTKSRLQLINREIKLLSNFK